MPKIVIKQCLIKTATKVILSKHRKRALLKIPYLSWALDSCANDFTNLIRPFFFSVGYIASYGMKIWMIWKAQCALHIVQSVSLTFSIIRFIHRLRMFMWYTPCGNDRIHSSEHLLFILTLLQSRSTFLRIRWWLFA